jgi:putative hydrolase of the HAD superfamily
MRVLIWDFDGTIGYREGGTWSRVLLELLRQEMPGVEATADQLRPCLQFGFPWHNPDQPHPEIQTPEQWWDRLLPVFAAAFQVTGIEISQARSLAQQVRHVYADPERWRLFDDALPTLDQLAAQRWTHVLLSNHIPELREIIDHLGLTPRLARVFNSAETGYEKPHPRAFQMVLDAFPDATAVWMIGDSVSADVVGAEASGIPAILVHGRNGEAKHVCARISEVQAVLARELKKPGRFASQGRGQ